MLDEQRLATTQRADDKRDDATFEHTQCNKGKQVQRFVELQAVFDAISNVVDNQKNCAIIMKLIARGTQAKGKCCYSSVGRARHW